MKIEFITDWRFKATVNGEERTFSILCGSNEAAGDQAFYVDEAKALAGDYDVRVGVIVEEEGCKRMTPYTGDNPMTEGIILMLTGGLMSGNLSPVVETSAEDEDEEWFGPEDFADYEDAGTPDLPEDESLLDAPDDRAPEDERPPHALTPEERLLMAIFGEEPNEGVSKIPRNLSLGNLIFQTVPDDGTYLNDLEAGNPDEDDGENPNEDD